ncbi:MAG TPA: hypothetical protein VGM39_08670, partial [Kofleriaceae bacterium]
MSNSITNDRVTGSAQLRMSNGLTSVLSDVLVIAASDKATTPWEKKLAYWLAQHDQSRTGLGCVGFDIEELGWTREDFAAQQRFLVDMIAAALARYGWERLPFTPTDSVLGALRSLHRLVMEFTPEHIRALDERVWTPEDLPEQGLCEVHRVYLHETGCIICNDAPIDAPPESTPNQTPEL